MTHITWVGAVLLFVCLAVFPEDTYGQAIDPATADDMTLTTADDMNDARESALEEGIPALSIGREGNLKVGMRIQPRYEFDEFDNTHDLMIRRSRLKLDGQFTDRVKYKFEWKVDNIYRKGITPKLEAENANLTFACWPFAELRVGLYDSPFGRDTLVSDSKLLVPDRTQVTNALKSLGIADNTLGVQLSQGLFEDLMRLRIGIYDNQALDDRVTTPMLGGRFLFSLLDRDDRGDGYKATHIGEGRYLDLAFSFMQQDNVVVPDAGNMYDITAMGGDVFFEWDGISFQAEYARYEKQLAGNYDVPAYGWYVQAGYLVPWVIYGKKRPEVAFQHQEYDPDTRYAGNRLKWDSIGVNYYFEGHNLKLQTAYVLKDEEGPELDNDLLQMQLQLDF